MLLVGNEGKGDLFTRASERLERAVLKEGVLLDGDFAAPRSIVPGWTMGGSSDGKWAAKSSVSDMYRGEVHAFDLLTECMFLCSEEAECCTVLLRLSFYPQIGRPQQ